jgi:hypothetical protein
MAVKDESAATKRVGSRPAALLAAAAALCCVAAGCASRPPAIGAGAPAPSQSAAPQSAARIDACSMIAPQDISLLLGVSVTGVSTGKTPQMGDCTWTNPSSEESVSLTISNPGTAPHNKLSASEPGFPSPNTPGPDGMRYLGGGQVEFAAGNRSNTVQVAVLRLSPTQANAAAVDLARKVAPKVPQ